jgi:predicted ATPase/DNA-binding winged helix-turn-helix (wHTH) protein
VRFSFEGFDLDTTTYELRRHGEPVRLEPQVFDVLAYLIRNRDHLVSKEELLDAVWGDRFVSESALTSRVKDARQALGDDGQQQRYIRTTHGRGYRFTAEVTATTADTADTADTGTTAHSPDSGGPVAEPATARPAAQGGPAATGGGPAATGGGLHNVPGARTPLFGRQAAIAEVAALLDDRRLVSLVGMGGTGKTRLAAATAVRVVDRFVDGVWFVDLVPARDGSSAETAIAHGSGLGLSTGNIRAQLARMLATRAVLLVLDNCEHVRDEVAGLLDHLLEHTAAPRFLVTSRVPLDLPDERRVPVPPLAVDGSSAPAIELFVSSAERFGATIQPSEVATVQRICAGLDGLPLAIELAAAQLRLLRPADVASRLDQRFELLRTRPRPGRERHASLVAVLEGTWDLMDPGEQELLGRLAAFPGPFDVVDVEQLSQDLVPGAAARTLVQLVDHSLVVSASTAESRFRLLETVRLFTQELTDTRRHSARHAAWCLDHVGAGLAGHLFDFSVASWCDRHYDDLREAERHLVAEGRNREAGLLVASTALATHCDAGARAADLLAGLDAHIHRLDDPALVARLHIVGVMAGMATRSPEVIAEHGQRALSVARESADPVLIAVALVLRSWSTVFTSGQRAVELVEEASQLAMRVGDVAVRDLADSYRSFHLAMMRRYDEAVEQAEAVVARAGPNPGYEYDVAITLLASCWAVEQPARALGLVDQLLGLGRLPEDSAMWANQVLAASVYASCGDRARAVALAEKVRTRLARAERDSLPDLLVPAAVLAHRLGDDERAARWVRAVRDAGRPTQSFQVTCLYRRLRETVGLADSSALDTATLEEIGDEAIEWMRSTVGPT